MTDIAVAFGAPDATAAGLEMQAVLALEIELTQVCACMKTLCIMTKYSCLKDM